MPGWSPASHWNAKNPRVVRTWAYMGLILLAFFLFSLFCFSFWRLQKCTGQMKSTDESLITLRKDLFALMCLTIRGMEAKQFSCNFTCKCLHMFMITSNSRNQILFIEMCTDRLCPKLCIGMVDKWDPWFTDWDRLYSSHNVVPPLSSNFSQSHDSSADSGQELQLMFNQTSNIKMGIKIWSKWFPPGHDWCCQMD